MPGLPKLREAYDFLVVGGGHAGLLAGHKAALLRHTSAVLDRGPKYSRSFYAPRMENIPGFPEGVSGHQLLDLQVAQLRNDEAWAGYFSPARATAARSVAGGFEVDFEWLRQRPTARGRALVLAMGVVDRMPVVDGKIDPIFPWANLGLIDFCVLCDGHTLPGKSVVVLGAGRFAARTALDLVNFAPRSLELVTHGEPLLADAPPEERAELLRQLDAAGIARVEATITGFEGLREREFHLRLSDGTLRRYEKGFSGLGWYEMNQAIPRSLGASFDAEGYVRTDEDGRVLAPEGRPIPGLYCVGDQRSGWNQIPEAWAMAERAVIHAWAEYL